MNVKQLKEKLAEFNDSDEVYAINEKGLYRRVEDVKADDNYPDVLIIAGDIE